MPRTTTRVFKFARRLRTPGLRWQYTACTAVSGKGGGSSSCQPPRIRIAQTSLERKRSGNAPTIKGTTICLGGRSVSVPESQRWSNVWIPRKRKARHCWRRRKRPSGGQNWGHRKVHYEYHRASEIHLNSFRSTKVGPFAPNPDALPPPLEISWHHGKTREPPHPHVLY